MNKHEHAIIVIKNDKNEYLQYYDNRWNGHLFMNCKLSENFKEQEVLKEITQKLNLFDNNLKCKYIKLKIHKKFSESAKKEKEYYHYIYNVEIENMPNIMKEKTFIIDDIKYIWLSMKELENDPRIQEINSDVVGFIKEIEIDQEAMQQAIEESKENSHGNYKDGGPFGTVVVKNGEIISKAHNTVIKSKDPTAHAEVNAIRQAAKKLGTHDLTGCKVYVNAEPCPMCLSAIIWSNIKEVYYANTKKDAADIGFRDDMIYEYIKEEKSDVITLNHIDNSEAIKVFEDFKNCPDKIMY